MRVLRQLPLIGIVAFLLAPSLYAQKAPPIPGVTGTIVTPETAKDEKKAADKAAVAVKEALVRPDKGPLADLKTGATVLVRHGTDMTEGVVTKIDRTANEITVRFEDKRVETLVLVDKASPDTRTVEYTDAAKIKITRYFKAKS